MIALAALLAGLAVLLLLPDPGARVARLSEPRGRSSAPAWLEGRVGSPPLRQRVMAGITAGLVVFILAGGPLGLLGALASAVGVILGLGRMGPRPPTERLRHELPDALDFLAICVATGLPMRNAIDTVAGVSGPATRALLGGVAAQLALGRAGPLAWEDLRGHEVWGRVASDVARAERSGTAIVGVLRVHAEDARQEARDAATKRARTVGVRSAIPLMACFLPAFILVGVVPIIAGLLVDFLG